MELVNSSSFVRDAVNRIAAASLAADGAPFRLSLCGGNTPREIYEALAGEDLDWRNFVITFGDERCVPPEHEQSNYRMARESLLDRVPIPEENILRLKGEIPAEEAADLYEQQLRARSGDEVFRHDLILLGMGEDGHTASLFPASRAIEESERLVVANEVAELAAWRLTFTYTLINAAKRVLFLVRGEVKRKIAESIVQDGEDYYPAAGVRPHDGSLVWLAG
jgi:6-phosphogluconolactonase